MIGLFVGVILVYGGLNVEAWLCTADNPCMCHHPAPNSAVYMMGCLMNPCPSMPAINDMPAGSLFVHHPQVNGCDNMIPGVFYNPGYGGGACIPIGSLDSGYRCCETTSGGFADPSDPSCARDSVTVASPSHTGTHRRHFDPPIIHPQPRATSVHQGHLGNNTKHHPGHHQPAGPQPVASVKPQAGHAYYIQNAVLCTMRFPPGDPHYTLIMCTAQCNEQFVFSGPSPDGNLAVGTIGGSSLCHGKAAVPWSCIMSTPDC